MELLGRGRRGRVLVVLVEESRDGFEMVGRPRIALLGDALGPSSSLGHLGHVAGGGAAMADG